MKPEVESETYIEQTSLACNLIQGWDMVELPLVPAVNCVTDTAKGGNWWEPDYCTVSVFYIQAGDATCAPYTDGIPLS